MPGPRHNRAAAIGRALMPTPQIVQVDLSYWTVIRLLVAIPAWLEKRRSS